MRTFWLCLALATLTSPAPLAAAQPSKPSIDHSDRSADSGGQYPNTFYRYRGKRGRWVFTNIAEQVPTNQRAASKVDLSHITLNPQLGSELDASMQAAFEQLSATPECKQARAQADHWLKAIWDEYNYLIILGGVFLAMILATPYALRRVDAPAWARTLTKAFMMLGFVALFMHTSMRAGKTYESLRSVAEPCERETWTKMATRQDERPSKLKLLVELQTMIRQAQKTDQDRLDELDKLLKQ